MSVPTLTAMVVGSMIGAGVFSLPARFGSSAGVFAAIIAWTIAGVGMLTLALVFQRLAIRRPELDSGVFAYAKAGFGDYVGFNSAFGYWASACAGNAFYWVFIMSTIGKAWPALGEGDTVIAALLSTVGIWVFAALIARGVKDAAAINRIVTVAKIVPILVFIAVAVVAIDVGVFTDNFWGTEDVTAGAIFDQVRNTMIIIVFVFLGIEGASVYFRYARRREDVGRATILGFVSVLCVFASVTLLSYGILPQAEIAALRQPSMAPLLAEIVGSWGTAFISFGVVISVLGAYLAWTLMAAEVLFIPAQDKDMPRFLSRQNGAGAPIAALALTSLMVQTLIIVVLFAEDSLDFLLDLCTSLSLIPYFLAAAFAVKVAFPERGSGTQARRALAIAVLATVYTVFLVFAAGPEFLILSCIIYAPGTILYVMARRENGARIFRPAEAALCGILVVGAVLGIGALATGPTATTCSSMTSCGSRTPSATTPTSSTR
ncbi:MULTISPECIES: basic amino acid/polyamine antiporter [unclassified Gordonia (in: high G+C Gram-positive bacteria)]|uniref:basic amino acid/polyamine antiporter n=1 Tax=unclassified Gordonia (in: high G+C Gram-positive bacteria) TaxID=2657482 RepID=UPI0010F74540|nr:MULTISPECIES: basic amino acid/polyamine antiporter [unclassified Gordonia (in: high G+C Gram-positive bacteria)]